MAQQLGDPDATDLPVEVQDRIRALLALVEADASYYEYFDLPRDADRKAIKRSYYALAALVHPDRHAGRKLGAWKPRMEQLFRVLTSAHDTLSDPAQRQLYDQLLPPEPPRNPTPAPPSMTRPVQTPPPASEPSIPAPAGSETTVGRNASTMPPLSSRTLNEAQRREALARRLRGGRTTLTGLKPTSAPTTPSTPSPPASTDALRAQAEAAEARGDLGDAVKVWRQLSTLCPDDTDGLKRYARALLSSRGDLHLAADLTQRVIRATPRDSEAYVLLADTYLAAHLPVAARSVLEHAHRLWPDDHVIEEKLARAQARLSQADRK